MKYVIEKNVPVPASNANGRTATLRQMEPGDSLVCDLVESLSLSVTARGLYGAGCCTRRKQADGTFRFWLISKEAKQQNKAGAAIRVVSRRSA